MEEEGGNVVYAPVPLSFTLPPPVPAFGFFLFHKCFIFTPQSRLSARPQVVARLVAALSCRLPILLTPLLLSRYLGWFFSPFFGNKGIWCVAKYNLVVFLVSITLYYVWMASAKYNLVLFLISMY